MSLDLHRFLIAFKFSRSIKTYVEFLRNRNILACKPKVRVEFASEHPQCAGIQVSKQCHCFANASHCRQKFKIDVDTVSE